MMKLTIEEKNNILDSVIAEVFQKAKMERLLLQYIAANSSKRSSLSTEDIGNYFAGQELPTSAGAIRGTILRIRHKLLKYKDNHPEQAYHIVLPEQLPHQGYTIYFKRNPTYNFTMLPAQDPWLNLNWNILQKQGVEGFWKGISLPDGGRGPLTLYMMVLAVYTNENGRIAAVLFSPSQHIKRIGLLEGALNGPIFSLTGKWHVHNKKRPGKIVDYVISVDTWPFRRSCHEAVGIAGRFSLYHETENSFQYGQIELQQARPGSREYAEAVNAFSQYSS